MYLYKYLCGGLRAWVKGNGASFAADVICDMWYDICYMLYVICYMLYVVSYMLYVIYYMLYVICYI